MIEQKESYVIIWKETYTFIYQLQTKTDYKNRR